MWFPKTYFSEREAGGWPDFFLITAPRRWFYEQNTQFRNFLSQELREGDIVITHHLPSPRSTPDRFKNDPSNAYFVSNMEDIIVAKRPSMWIHGHTHDPFDYMLHDTRVVCNPQDYPNRRIADTIAKKIIELHPPNSEVECQPDSLEVAGSNPAAGTNPKE